MVEPTTQRPPTNAGDPERRQRTGLVTLLFTDMVGSTALKQRLGDLASSTFFDQHHQIVRHTLAQSASGREIETAGDSFLITFDTPSDAVKFALLLQTRLRALSLEQNAGALDRIGIHVGEVVIKEDQLTAKPRDLYGIPIDTCARIMSLAAGGQTLMSRFAFDTARPMLRGEDVGDLQWLNHGAYQLKGIDEPIEVCEVRPAGSATSPPTTNEKASRLATDGDLVLGWRPALEQLVPATRWKLIEKLGEGGFGEVWLGQHEVLKEKRVFKFCFRADRVRSLKRELTLFRILKEKVGEHPNIAPIRGVNFDSAPYYIEMDYVAGQDLKAWCDTHGGAARVAEGMKLEIVAQMAGALQAAHECGIVHRDVKPGNILISKLRSEVGNPKSVAAKLTDFGIGQVLSEEYLAGMTRAGFTETMLGSSTSGTGTQMYMAPELLAGKPASPRSDIYSLGMVLYQLLIGDFSHAVTVDWERRITDPVLREDLEKCFAGDPGERFAEAGQLAKNLRTMDARRFAFAKQEKAAARGRIVRRTTAGVAVVAAVSLLALFSYQQGGGRRLEAKIAVLPLDNLSGELTQQYFAEEMTDDLIAKLGQISALRVIGRATAMQFKKTTNSMPEIARRLNVDAVVQGTLKRERDKVQMGVRLFNGSADRLLWSTSYERDLSDVFALQNEVALTVATKLKVKLMPEEQARLANAPRVDPKALELYYRGRVGERTGAGADAVSLEQIRLYQGAVEISKDFAPAWAALAGAYTQRHYWVEPEPDKAWKRKAQTAVLTAITLDPNLAEAWAQNGRLHWGPGNFDHDEALRLFDRALQLNSSSIEALRWIAIILTHAGFFDEAAVKWKMAVALDPLARSGNPAYALLYHGSYKQSLLFWPESDPKFTPAHGSHWAWALFADRQTNAAKAKVEEYLKNSKDLPGELTAMKALLLAADGDEAGAIAQLKIAEQRTKTSFGETHHATYFIACAYVRLHKPQEALQWLNQTADTGFPCYPLFRDDPNLNSLRDDPGFIAFLQKQEIDWKKRKVEWAKFADAGKKPAPTKSEN